MNNLVKFSIIKNLFSVFTYHVFSIIVFFSIIIGNAGRKKYVHITCGKCLSQTRLRFVRSLSALVRKITISENRAKSLYFLHLRVVKLGFTAFNTTSTPLNPTLKIVYKK